MWEQGPGAPEGPAGRAWVRPFGTVLTLLGGVVLPAVSLVVEATSHMCAEAFFDPIPTTWHVVMVAFVPLVNLQVWLAVRKGATERPVLLGLANAAAIGVSAFYTVLYLPLLPIAFVALMFAGMGLLPMAPAFSLVSGIILRRRLRRIAPACAALKWRGLVAGLALSLAAVVLVELPITLTRIGLQMASQASSPERRARGLRLLRVAGNRDYLLRACYWRAGVPDLAGFLFSLNDPVAPQEAREIYYRLTGETFDTSRPPTRLGGNLSPDDTFDFDPDQGGTVIAGKIRGLSLSGSLIDGSVDADAALGYVEWTLTFRNDSAQQQEARAQVQLPPGGVVSRLTLWVNGEEREAAFAGRERTRAAYQQVAVRERRDPVLVTTSGRDRVLVQAFPVPADGGELKLRFGVTIPLALEDRARGLLRLPHLLERNFGIPDTVRHSVWVESKRPLQAESSRMRAEQPEAQVYALRGTYSDTELSGPGGVVRLERDANVAESWTRDPLKEGGEVVRQFVREKEAATAARLVLVVDTSQSMKQHGAEIVSALKKLPPHVETRLILADGNGAYEEGMSQHVVSASATDIARALEAASFEGGADNVPALIRAWEVAAEGPNGVIVWVHGSQGIELSPVEELRRTLERRAGGPMLYTVQAVSGPNRVVEGLDGFSSVTPVARLGRLQSDLERLFGEVTGQRRGLELVRASEKPARAAASQNGKETSAHLARLWANDEVSRLIAAGEKGGTEKAVEVAARYQLVTPVSGAVVLETAEQYAATGLRPVGAGTVPTIPEPEMVLLVALAAAVFLFMFYRQKLKRRGGQAG